jgi:fructokinase
VPTERAGIVVAGEALVDLTVSAQGVLSDHLGGGPFNAARTIGRLEQPVSYLGRLSSDRFGTRLREELERDGVSLSAVIETSEPTTLALAELDGRGSATYQFYTQGTSAPGLTRDDALRALPGSVGALCVGTLGLVLEPMATALEAVVERLRDSALIMVDPNCRPSTIEDPAAYRARLARIVASSDVVKVSDQDLEWLRPGMDPSAAALELLDQGADLVLLTRGGEGVTVLSPGFETDVPAPRVEVVDTIGAGDAFCGAFLAWWTSEARDAADLGREDVVVAAARFACLVAARTCERAGADPPRRAAVGF